MVSSALETSIGLRAGLALAAALPELPYACGLNTAGLLADDVAATPLSAVDGVITLAEVEPDPAALTRTAAPPEVAAVLAGSAHADPGARGARSRWLAPRLCARVIISELISHGVRELVLAPGSRSAPLAYEAYEADRIGLLRLHVRIDERGAGLPRPRPGQGSRERRSRC